MAPFQANDTTGAEALEPHGSVIGFLDDLSEQIQLFSEHSLLDPIAIEALESLQRRAIVTAAVLIVDAIRRR